MNRFKTTYIPNADGSNSAVPATNANCVFLDTYNGDNDKGDGTRNKPFKGGAVANLKAVAIGASYIVFRGVINEALATTKNIIGDDINQVLRTDAYSVTYNAILRLTRIGPGINSIQQNLIITPTFSVCSASSAILGNSYILAKLGILSNSSSYYDKYNMCTINGISFASTLATSSILNSLLYGFLNINSIPILTISNAVFPSTTIFKYNGVAITQPAWTTDSKANVQKLRDAYVAKGMPVDVSISTFVIDPVYGTETCQVVLETAPNVKIFNAYDTNKTTVTSAVINAGAVTTIPVASGNTNAFKSAGDIWVNGIPFTYTSKTLTTFVGASQTMPYSAAGVTILQYGDVTDFSLNPNFANVALFASSTFGYVGALKPAIANPFAGKTAIDVDANGNDNGVGSLISVSGNSILFSGVGDWNRLRSDVIAIPVGSKFQGFNIPSTDGTAYGQYFGKKQNLIDAASINPGDALLPNTTYKVHNAVVSAPNAVVYKGITYAPSTFFTTDATTDSFSLITSGSGTVARKLLASPCESGEVLPYDSVDVVSAFPRFSCPLNGDVRMLFYSAAGATRYGKVSGAPVLFSDLKAGTNMLADFPNVCDKISYYDNWAVTNADQEFITLATSANFTNSIPILTYFKTELNAHNDPSYA